MGGGARSLSRIGIFYDGGYFSVVNNFYNFTHHRRSRLHLGGLHDFVRREVAAAEDIAVSYCQVVDVHWFRGRLPVGELSSSQLEADRIWDDVLTSFGIVTHYLPVTSRPGQPRQEKGIDVWFALEVLELALMNRFDVVVLITGDGDYVPLVRKLNARGVRVMLLGWHITWRTPYGEERAIRTAEALAREVTYRVRMEEVIGDEVEGADAGIESLFVHRAPRSPRSDGPPREMIQGEEMTGRIASLLDSYGFISPDHGGENIFFHASDVAEVYFRELRLGDPVSYVAATNERGPCARRVILLEDWQEGDPGERAAPEAEPGPEPEAFVSFSPSRETRPL